MSKIQSLEEKEIRAERRKQKMTTKEEDHYIKPVKKPGGKGKKPDFKKLYDEGLIDEDFDYWS